MRSILVIPVRLSAGGRVVQTTTRAVTPSALLIRCVAPPPPGTAVEVRLYLPDGGPEDLRGTVVDSPQDEGPGCGVELEGVSEAQRQRLQRAVTPPVLQRAPTPLAGTGPVVPGRPLSQPAPPQRPTPLRVPEVMTPVEVKPVAPAGTRDHRALARVPVQLKVCFDTIEELADQLAVNLSSGGMFVRCSPPPLLGAEVVLSIELPGSWPPLLCRAVVAHRVVPEQARTTGQITGAGVQFLDADDRFRNEIDRYVAKVLGRTPLE